LLSSYKLPVIFIHIIHAFHEFLLEYTQLSSHLLYVQLAIRSAFGNIKSLLPSIFNHYGAQAGIFTDQFTFVMWVHLDIVVQFTIYNWLFSFFVEGPWDTMRHYETLWVTMRHYETLWETMRHYETLWDTMRHYETVEKRLIWIPSRFIQ